MQREAHHGHTHDEFAELVCDERGPHAGRTRDRKHPLLAAANLVVLIYSRQSVSLPAIGADALPYWER
jgi:hypothetical protein